MWESYYTPIVKKPRTCESNCENLLDVNCLKYSTVQWPIILFL